MDRAYIICCIILITLILLLQRIYIKIYRSDSPILEVGLTLFALQIKMDRSEDLKKLSGKGLRYFIPYLKATPSLLRRGRLIFKYRRHPEGNHFYFEYSSRLIFMIIFLLNALYYKTKAFIKKGISDV